jgi:DnaJ family protein C protein 2
MILCPNRPKSFTKQETELHKFATHALEPVGEGYWQYLSRLRLGLSLAKDLELREAIETVQEECEQVNDDNDDEFINSLDPKDWKEQDHYAVIGCLKRFAATEDDLKRAYRKRVLRYHPDKTDNPANDSAFKCIQKAWELLSDPKRRKEWDSVDPTFDEHIPSAKAKGEFFSIYASVFEKESRFSKNLPVPVLGGANDSREAVEKFYEFWFSFESWRSFEALDEEDANAGECREEKRWIERKNKAQRNKLKKEDVSRVARLVDQAFSIDPRIKKFKKEDKELKDAKKNKKNAAQNAAKEAALAQQEEERQEKERLEALAKEKVNIKRSFF